MAKLALPKLPKKEEKENIQAEIDQNLGQALRSELAKKKVKIKDFIEWAAKAYLLNANPKEAERLGIVAEDV